MHNLHTAQQVGEALSGSPSGLGLSQAAQLISASSMQESYLLAVLTALYVWREKGLANLSQGLPEASELPP